MTGLVSQSSFKAVVVDDAAWLNYTATGSSAATFARVGMLSVTLIKNGLPKREAAALASCQAAHTGLLCMELKSTQVD